MNRWIGKLAVVGVLALCSSPLVALAQHRDHGGRHGWSGDIRYFEGADLHRWRSGYWHHGRHSGRVGWWWVIGGMWYFYPQPVYPYPDPYLPPTVIVQPAPAQVPAPVPVAPVVPAAPPPPVWYYCEASSSYYPYVPSCPGGWKTVPATPQGAPQ